MVSLTSLVYTVTEHEGQQLTFQVVKENLTDVTIDVVVEKVFQGSAFPDCRALGVCKLKIAIL